MPLRPAAALAANGALTLGAQRWHLPPGCQNCELTAASKGEESRALVVHGPALEPKGSVSPPHQPAGEGASGGAPDRSLKSLELRILRVLGLRATRTPR